jgi:hypothetical protein
MENNKFEQKREVHCMGYKRKSRLIEIQKCCIIKMYASTSKKHKHVTKMPLK